MPKGRNGKREQQLKEYTTLLAERLAIAVAYLCAIDDAVDPFRKKDAAEYSDDDWIIATLAMRARTEIFDSYRFCDPYSLDCTEIIGSARGATRLKIRDTEVYRECLTSVRNMLRGNHATPRGRGTKGPISMGSDVEAPV